MQVYKNSFGFTEPTVVALGNFDGVHLGHTELIRRMLGTPINSVVYTFDTHPVNIISNKSILKSINTNSEKIDIFNSLGVDAIVFDDFSEVKNLSPESFVDEILIKKLNAQKVICGYNYRFGKNAIGDVSLLKKMLEEKNVALDVVDKVELDGVPVSSTQVRTALQNADMEYAQRLLGRPFFVNSTVVHGKALGRRMGFPTVNETFEESRLVLPYGVYFGRCVIDGSESRLAVVNVGVRPTVDKDSHTPSIEAHLIDFDGDLYGKKVRIEFYKKHRNEIKFDNITLLCKQIENDISACKKYFAER